MDDRASLLHAIEWMRKTGAQRIPVIDNAGELQTIVTESGILKFLHAVRNSPLLYSPLLTAFFLRTYRTFHSGTARLKN